MATKTLTCSVQIERHDPGLPRYVVVPSSVVRPWRLEGTTVVEGTLDGTDLGRRTMKRWDEERWFLDLPERLCRRAGVDTGDEVELVIRRASTELPAELESLLAGSLRARERWRELSASRRRMVREHVLAAKRPETRQRRARKALDPLGIGPAVEDEIEALSRLAVRSKAHWGYPPEWLEEWARELTITPATLREQRVFVARRDGVALGFYGLAVAGELASLEHLWVDPPFLGRGVGAALFRHAREEARREGCTVLQVDSDPHAEGFYLRLGAVRHSKVPAPVAGVARELPRLRLDLRGVEA